MKKYIVELAKGEQECLKKLISAGAAPAHLLNYSHMLKAEVPGKHAGSRALLD